MQLKRKTYLNDEFIGDEIDTVERCQYCGGRIEPTEFVCSSCGSVVESLIEDDDL